MPKNRDDPHVFPFARRLMRSRDWLSASVARFGLLPLLAFGLLAPVGVRAEDPSGSALPDIVVWGTRVSDAHSVAGSKTEVAIGELPLSAEVLTNGFIEGAGFTSLDALLQSVTGALISARDGGIFSDITVRGFSGTPLYRNGVNQSFAHVLRRSLANVESVEILKGPYGALFGPGEPGGSVNVVTKQPQAMAATSAAFSFDGEDLAILNFDTTGPLPDLDALRYRLIVEYEAGDTFRDFVTSERWFINPQANWRASDSTALRATFEYLRDERQLDPGLVAINNHFVLPRSRFLGEPGLDPAKASDLSLALSSVTNLNDAWTLDIVLNARSTDFSGDTAEPVDLVDSGPGFELLRELQRASERTTIWIGQAELRGTTTWRSAAHHLVMGIEGTHALGTEDLLASDAETEAFAIDPFAPVYGQPLPSLLAAQATREQQHLYSGYAQDLWELAPHWRLLAGARFDYLGLTGRDGVFGTRFDSISRDFHPRLGLVFTPTAAWSWFTSYSRSMEPNEGLSVDGRALRPSRNRALEAGLKWAPQKSRLRFAAAVFDIRQSDVTTDAPNAPGFELQLARQRSRGVDVALEFQPAPGWLLHLKYDWMDADISRSPELPDGTDPLNIPAHQLRLLGRVTHSIRRPDDLSIRLSLGYLSERQGSLDPEALALRLPGYIHADAYVAWAYSRQLGLALEFANLGDSRVIASSQADALQLTPLAPFMIRGQISLRF